MSKSWSSFEGQQLLQENWRNFLSEETEPSASEKFFNGPALADQFDVTAPSDSPNLGRGLDSVDNEDSLKRVLAPILDGEKGPEHIQALINVIAQIAGDEGIMLELSLKGLNSEQDRIIDSAETALILNTIAGFNLSEADGIALIKALNYWGRVNSVKFTPPPAAAPAVGNTTDPRDDTPQDATATSDDDELEPEPEPESDTPADEESAEENDSGALKMAELGVETLLNAVSAAGIFPPIEATGVPTIATFGSFFFNLARGKIGAALFDLVALAPVVGKASKAGKLGKAMQAAMAGKNFAAGRHLIHLAGNAENARTAIQTMKATKHASNLSKAGSSAKKLVEEIPEDWISAAIYKKQDDGEYWIDWIIDKTAQLAELPVIPDSIGSAAVELKQTVADLRKAIPPSPIDPRDVPEPGTSAKELNETYDRWQTIAGINKRVL